jgi:phosphatidylglycerophosphate synthase
MNTGTVHIAPTRLGEMTTFVQICFITWLFVCYFFSWVPVKTYWMLLIVLLCMVAASLFQYSRIGFTAWSSSAKKDYPDERL